MCCPATLLGHLLDVEEETCFSSLWLTRGRERSALASPRVGTSRAQTATKTQPPPVHTVSSEQQDLGAMS